MIPATTSSCHAGFWATNTQKTMTEQKGAKFKAAITGQSSRTARGLPYESKEHGDEEADPHADERGA